MSYTRVNWQDAPSVSTPLSASNLNKMDAGIKQNADDIEALQQHTYDSALDDTSTNAPQTKVVKKAIEDAVESVTISTDPTLSNEGQAADAKATGEAVAQVKNAMAKEVIIEGFKRNESQAFNYTNAESNKIMTTTGNKIDYDGYWITHNIPVGTATKVICNKTAFRIGFYTNNSFSYVDSVAALSATTIPSGTEYLVIEFRNAIIPFDSADAVIITLGDTISKTAKYYETNISDVKELVDDVFLKDANLAFEQGSLSSVGGTPFDSTERCRTNFILLDGLGKININGDYAIQIFLYDKNKAYLDHTTSYRVSVIYLPNVAKICPNAVYVRFTVQSRTGSTTNVAECITNITFDYNDINRKYRYVDSYPYSYTGEKIDVSNRFDYRLFGVLYGTQAGCIYRNKLLRTNLNGTINIWDIDTLALVNTCTIDAASPFVPHCNTAMFGNFYDDADPFPLLYVSVYNTANAPYGTCYVYRITGNDTQGYASELKQIITIGFANTEPWTDGNDTTPYGNFVVDAENNVLYAYTLKDAHNVTRFFAFELPDIETASVTLTVDDIVSQFDTGYIRSPQDNTFNNGKVYICSGFGVSESHAKMSVVDIPSHKIVSVIDFDNNGIHFEPEMLDIYNGHLLIGESSVYEILT